MKSKKPWQTPGLFLATTQEYRLLPGIHILIDLFEFIGTDKRLSLIKTKNCKSYQKQLEREDQKPQGHECLGNEVRLVLINTH
jgi:hypothetical protein